MMYIGIDPGATGAMCVIIDNVPMIFDFGNSAGLKFLRRVSENHGLYGPVSALIERVHAMPHQGVSSMFKFGANFGQWIGRLEALLVPYDFVTPKSWQKKMFGAAPKLYHTKGGRKALDNKAMSLSTARRLFPQCQALLSRKKDHNRADALLIAEYNRRAQNE